MRALKAYDVLQVSTDGGKTWEDWSTLRDERDFMCAKRYVDSTIAPLGVNMFGKSFRVVSGNMPDRGTVILESNKGSK